MRPGEARGGAGGLPARRVWLLVGIVTVLGVALTAAIVWIRGSDGADLRPPIGDPSLVASFAGSFPTEEADLLENPRGITWHDGLLYVTDADAGTVVVFEEEGSLVTRWRVPAHPLLEVAYPIGVAVLDDGTVAVVDVAGERVLLVEGLPEEAEPRWQDLDLAAAGGDDGPTRPAALAAAGDRLYVATDDGTIKVYGSGGDLVDSLLGDQDGGPRAASGLFVGPDRLYISDSNTGRVFAVGLNGGDSENGSTTGGARPLPVKFSLPRGVVADEAGIVYVSDVFGPSVSVLTPEGDLIATIGGENAETQVEVEMEPEGMPLRPEDVAWSPTSGRLFVTDAARGSVLVYNLESR